jgi:carbon storage regulator
MLVLSRKSGESIVIDGDIKVTIVKVRGNRVRLGIEAPSNVTVKRTEIQLRHLTALPANANTRESTAACATA